jgi:hypothetical protein
VAGGERENEADDLAAQTQAATDVASTTAVVHGTVVPDGRTAYFFVYGVTALDQRTPPTAAGPDDDPVAVSATLQGLTPSTTYRVRLIAAARRGVARGAEVTFTTLAPASPAPPIAPPPIAPPPAAPTPPSASAPPSAPAPAPVLGRSVNVAPRAGAVSVRSPGASAYAPVSAVASLPVGALIDTRKGSVTLRTALPGGRTQSGIFHDGLFEVRQTRGGMTELVLRGAKPSCGARGARTAQARKRKPPRALWGHDNHGRFRTRGSNSVATVRGTTWYVEDRCGATLTRVRSGSVSVRDLRRHRTVVVRAGHSYLARTR